VLGVGLSLACAGAALAAPPGSAAPADAAPAPGSAAPADAAPGPADDAPAAAAITVAISEGLDAAAIRDQLAAELGGAGAALAPAEPGGACALPCLAVVRAGDSATITYAPLHGGPRARTLALGADPEQWPLVLALLAGNVVRDEAADVLALIPTGGVAAAGAPAAAALARAERIAPAPPLRPRPRRAYGFGLVPVLSTDGLRVGQIHHHISFDAIAGVSGGSSGFTASGVADVELGDVEGAQLGGVAAIARSTSGTQIAGVAAVSGELHGVQLAGAAAIAGTARGAQVAGVASVARGPAELQIAGVVAAARGAAGTQIAGVAAAARGPAHLQIAGVAAASGGPARVQVAGVAATAPRAHVQIAGVASVARGLAHVQIAGVANVAQRVSGAQVGVVNIARRVDGVQVGVINVGSADGISLGLINIVPRGRTDLEASVDSSQLGTLLLRHGGRRWHNVYGVGGARVDERGGARADDVWMYGLGFGPTWRARSAVVDLDLLCWQVNHGAAHYDGVSLLGQLRLSIAHAIGPAQLVVGGALNTHVSSDPASPLLLERRMVAPPPSREVRVETWPSAFVGVRI
jgi:hypothetical protein